MLIHFREGAVAFAADIEAMFSRIRLKPEDAAYHRFLWAEEDGSVTTYQMDRLAFGDKCSPFVAIATTRQAAADHGEESQEIIKAITDHLYMDDYLDSTRTEEEAIVRAKGVTKTLAKGDFIFQAWVSNSPTFLAAVSPAATKAADDGIVLKDTNSQAKVLGVRWNPYLGLLLRKKSRRQRHSTSRNRFPIKSNPVLLLDPPYENIHWYLIRYLYVGNT